MTSRSNNRTVRCRAMLLCALWAACALLGRVCAAEDDPSINNVWVDVPIRQVLRDVAMQTRVGIAVDPAVPDTLISLEAEDMTIEECLRQITAGQGLTFRKVDGPRPFYVIGSGRPDSPTFNEMCEMKRVYLHYVTAKHVRNSLPRDLQPYVTSGERNTEVLVFAPEDRTDQLLQIIAELDKPEPQVVLEALVVEVSEEGGSELGIDWTRSGRSTLFSLTESADRFTGVARFASIDERQYNYLQFTLRMLISRGLAKVRLRPRVATVNGQKATIDISLEQYFNIVTDLNGAFLRTDLKVVRSGVILQMTPHIGQDGDITVDVSTDVSDVASEPSNVQLDGLDISSVGALPIIRRRKADTTVRVKDGDAIVIGGLIESTQREKEKRVPILGSVPLLGLLFRSTTKVQENKEVLIFITPRLVTAGPSDLDERHALLNVPDELSGLRSVAEPSGLNPEGLDLLRKGMDDAVSTEVGS